MASTPRILYIQYTNPAGYPPLEHSSRMLADAGWQVLFLGTGAVGADALRFPPHPNVQVRQMPFSPAGWRQKLHYARFVAWVLLWALRWRPHWVYASDLLSCPAGWLLSAPCRMRVVYHEHDSPASPPSGLFQRLCRKARAALSRRADLCVLPNPRRIDLFREQTGRAGPTLCVHNCPRADEVGAPRSPSGNTLRLYYHGNIGPRLVPPGIVQALASLGGRAVLRVVGYETLGNEGYGRRLCETAERLGIPSAVEVLPAVPRRRLLLLARECDLGLALMPTDSANPNLAFLVGASNKPFDYLSAGLALLVSDVPDWRAMYVEPGYGLACDPDDPASIATALRWFLDHPEQMRAMGEAGRRRILNDWNYETQFRPVWQTLGGEKP